MFPNSPDTRSATADTASGRTAAPSGRWWRPGVRARLLLAFVAITALAVLAASAALHAFREVGARLETIEARAPLSLSAIELSRLTERVIGAAPALLGTSEPARRERVRAGLATSLRLVDGTLRELRRAGATGAALIPLESAVAGLDESLDALDALVEHRLATSARVSDSRRALLLTDDEVRRLLEPWLAILDEETSTLAAEVPRSHPAVRAEHAERLAAALGMQRRAVRARRQFSAAVATLNDVATAERVERIAILRFRSGVALRDLAATAAGLDERLRPLFLEQVTRLTGLVEGPGSIAASRSAELRLLADARGQLEEASARSATLERAVDELGDSAKRDIERAILAAIEVQHASARILVAIVAASLLGSLLIVWLYVERRVVRRLGTLGEATLAIAGGDLVRPLDVRGGDEIAAMGRAIDVLRRNTAERDELLLRQARAAEGLEREIASRTAELSRANAFKARFLASASHDLRQPLHALNLFVGQLGGTSMPAAHAPLIERIDASLASMNVLFDALLDMSRLEAGVLEAEPGAFRIQRLLTRLEATFSEAARAKGLRLRVVPNGAWVCSDAVLLERIASNLVANAVRHTARGSVLVGCRRRGGRLRLDVLDSGPGIARARQREIFGEFHQLAPQRRDGSSGLGLGLAIVDGLARLLGHRIELDSRPGHGSRFSIELPLAPAADASDEPSRDVRLADPLPGASIVVIDDDESVREGMRGTLEGWGCSVVVAATAAVALERIVIDDGPPDLIIADLHLGGARTGIAAIARVRAVHGDGLPALLISGDTAPERAREAAAAGHRLLRKPIRPIRLRAMLSRLLGRVPSDAAVAASATAAAEAPMPSPPPRCGCPPSAP